MSNDELRDARAGFVRYLDTRLVGPVDGEDEEFAGTPLLRYMMGMLFPKTGEEVELVDDGTGDDDQSADEDADDPASSASHRPLPSSLGLSFLVEPGAILECEVRAAMYAQKPVDSKGGRGSKQWKRRSLPKATVSIDLAVRTEPRLVLGDKAQLHVNARPWANGGHLVTVSLVNAIDAGGKAMDPAKALFQVGLSISAPEGGFLPYPRAKSAAASSEDEAEVRYLYRNSPIYARGHGVAAIWDVGANGDCKRVHASFMPTAEVRAATFEIQAGTNLDPRYRDIEFLAFNEDVLELQKVLSGVGHAFGDWLGNEERLASQSGEAVGLELVARCKQWHERINQGIDLLADPVAHEAFVMANRAMYWQMLMAREGRDGPFPASARKGVPALSRGYGFQWRPFQIAFFLGVLPSLLDGVDPSLNGVACRRDDRDIVDVIWFPTGGGKTEAYLLVAAFELIRRRLVHGGNDQAAAVLSRYTLRMLTAQQFQRTGILVSALELLRRQDPKRYGARPFSVGLWVGQSLTPNKFGKALEAHEKWVASPSTEKNPFLLDRCPACGTSIVDDARGIVGVHCGESIFAFHCLSPECEFHTNIPMQVVDEALYREPPSILLGTLDKFANLTWDERPKSFFSGPDGNSPPPSLVIQDELHLISGPLGSISAPYEVAIDSIIRSRNKGQGAKVIASTATIRNSREQVRGIYGRESTVFPSPVRNWDDAFFFRLEDTATTPGRLYVGAMGQGTTTPVVSMVWTSAALLQASNEVALPEPLNDAYWTVLAYLNSRRELGRTITAASQEIPDRMKAIADASDNVRGVSQIMELSSQMASDMGDAIRTLQRKGTEAKRAVDFVPCTNIISVGVDVDRLGLMLVNGQPKLTSEYIQASSRVGRSRFAPGLVVTLYSPAKPRDRSHYEDFCAYHDSFYRFVEPTSVTPYAPPARKRTLHSAIIAMVRHATPWGANDRAGCVRFDDPVVKALLCNFKARIRAADRTEADEVADEIDHIVDAWDEQSQAGANLRYVITSRQFAGVETALIRDYGEPMKMGMYEAMRSVRSVDPDVLLRPVGRGG